MQSDRQRWLALWQRLNAHGDPHAVYDDLVARYSEPHRAYHTLAHIRRCLDEFELVKNFITRPDAVELALWYHDAIYNTKANDNEEKSAALARTMMRNAGLPDTLRQFVTDCIIATKHTAVPADPDICFLLDIDLSGLGQSENIFDKHGLQIRKEYEWVPERLFASKRTAILQSFLNRPNIYLTQSFRSKYEAQARQNIIRAITQLANRI